MAKVLQALCVAAAFGSAQSQSNACAADGSDYSYTETVGNQARVVVTNHCPNHQWTSLNPNYPVAGDTTYRVPKFPYLEPTATVDLSEQGGSVGVLFNGAMIFSAYGGSRYGKVSSYETTAAYAEGDTFDECGCHGSSDSSASYHCHVPPHCLLNQLGDTGTAHSPQIGWAPDGFPVYGPYGSNGVMMQLCSVKGATSTAEAPCADECGGFEGAITPDDGYLYRYYIMGPTGRGLSCTTPDEYGKSEAAYYPMTPLCYRGCVPDGQAASSNIIQACSAAATVAYTFETPSILYPSGLSTNACPGGSCDSSGTTTDQTCIANVGGSSTPTEAAATPTEAAATPTEATAPTRRQPPTQTPSPTSAPTDAPTDAPTRRQGPTQTPSPTSAPTDAPTDAPTAAPTDAPTDAPTAAPTAAPTDAPTAAPTPASETAIAVQSCSDNGSVVISGGGAGVYLVGTETGSKKVSGLMYLIDGGAPYCANTRTGLKKPKTIAATESASGGTVTVDISQSCSDVYIQMVAESDCSLSDVLDSAGAVVSTVNSAGDSDSDEDVVEAMADSQAAGLALTGALLAGLYTVMVGELMPLM